MTQTALYDLASADLCSLILSHLHSHSLCSNHSNCFSPLNLPSSFIPPGLCTCFSYIWLDLPSPPLPNLYLQALVITSSGKPILTFLTCLNSLVICSYLALSFLSCTYHGHSIIVQMCDYFKNVCLHHWPVSSIRSGVLSILFYCSPNTQPNACPQLICTCAC